MRLWNAKWARFSFECKKGALFLGKVILRGKYFGMPFAVALFVLLNAK